MFMAQITQTDHQQETLLLKPIYLRGRLSPSFSVKVFSRLHCLPGCRDLFFAIILHFTGFRRVNFASVKLFVPLTYISATVFCNDAACVTELVMMPHNTFSVSANLNLLKRDCVRKRTKHTPCFAPFLTLLSTNHQHKNSLMRC